MKSKRFENKVLSVAALAGATLLGVGANGAMAETDTLAQTTLGENSGYTLTKTDTKGENTITKYEVVEVTRYYDKTTGAPVAEADRVEGVEYKVVQEKDLVPVYYNVNLAKTTYGEDDSAKYYSWTKDSNGNYTIGETTQDKAQITVKYDTSNQRISLGTSTDISSTPLVGIYVAQNFSYPFDRSEGGVIDNWGTIGDISGAFIGNYTSTYPGHGLGASGGVINNQGEIGNIMGDFIGNYASSSFTRSSYYPDATGGAIFNNGASVIGDITGDFIGNYAFASSLDFDYDSSFASGYTYAYGGAIYNGYYGTIGDITGDFIGNYASSSAVDYSPTCPTEAFGGAIYNYGTIGDITGNFIGNYVSSSGDAYGGAIYNSGNIGNIIGNFEENYASYYGGAIYNTYEIESITCDFVANNVHSTLNTTIGGGAIYNSGTIGDITGDFIGNYASSFYGAEGGAIDNRGIIGNITGDFIGNYVSSSSYDTKGGAIYNSNTIGDITGDFIGNYASSSSSSSSYARGGAIYNNTYGTIGDITGDFIDNYAKTESGEAEGGAIYNDGTIGDIICDFIGNYASSSSDSSTNGGAIFNQGIIGDVTGDFIGNYVSTSSWAQGGAIFQVAGFDSSGRMINSISGNFIGNYAKSENGIAYAGAIVNGANIGKITGDFLGNYATASSYVLGGAIFNYSNTAKIDTITSDFIGNYAYSISGRAQGGAIYNFDEAIINTLTGEFNANYAQSTSGNANGGAIYNFDATIGSKDENGNLTGGLINSSFVNNYAKTEFGTAGGGAIWTNKDMNFIAEDGYTSVISGNYVVDIDGKRPEAIQVENSLLQSSYIGVKKIILSDKSYVFRPVYSLNFATSTFSLINNTNSKTIIDDQIVGTSTEYAGGMYYSSNGVNQYVELNEDGTYHHIDTPEAKVYAPKLNITGDGTGLVQLNNDVINMDVSLTNSTLHLGLRDNVLDNNNLTLNSGLLSMINNQVGTASLSGLTVLGNTDLAVDVDLANSTMDRLSATTYGQHTGTVNVSAMNLLSDATQDTTSIIFADAGLKDNVTTTVSNVAYTPIYKYDVSYDKSGENGMFIFARPSTGSTGNASDGFNPAVLAGTTSTNVGALATMNQSFAQVFSSSVDYMNIPYLERVAMKNKNRYALSLTGDTTGMGRFSPLYQAKDEELVSSVWVKPYAVFENVPLKNGPKVSNISYGTLVGFSGDMETIKNGWDRVFTGYMGYNGASQHYAGVDSTQNGGLLGGTVSLYKGNFFNVTSLSVGANVANNQTMYGNDNYTMLMSGVANKTGYNFEFKEGKLILQPSLMMSYTFVNTFDYTNVAGVRIDNKPLHALQLAPGVKAIGNLKNGWQPYASVSMVWNVMGESDATANGVKLPEMSIKPYVQYGVGLQKRVKDHFTAYGQAMIQNGGRNGISLTAGFRWALGHDGCKYDDQKVKKQDKKEIKIGSTEVNSESSKVDKVQQESSKKVLKQLKPSTKVVETKTPETVKLERKVLKQMTPQQKAAMMGSRYKNTSRTAKQGMLRQL